MIYSIYIYMYRKKISQFHRKEKNSIEDVFWKRYSRYGYMTVYVQRISCEKGLRHFDDLERLGTLSQT